MANTKVVRSRLRSPHHLKTAKRKKRTRKLGIPAELHAPITGEVERKLKQLVTKLGETKVREALDPLITKCKWNDCQCVANSISRIAREK